MNAASLLASLVVCGSLISIMQSTPLPSWAQAYFHKSWSCQFYLPVSSAGSEVLVVGRVVNTPIAEGDEHRQVVLRYHPRFGDEGTTLTIDEVEHTTYVPTAVCPKAGTTTTLYVAGWVKRSGSVVIEEWTLGEGALGSSGIVGGDPTSTTFSPPTITRRLLYAAAANELHPVIDMAFNIYSGRLILLSKTGDTGRMFQELDVANESLEPSMLDAAEAGNIFIEHNALGLFVRVGECMPWATYCPFDTFHSYRDMDFNGIFEVSEEISYEAYNAMFPGATFDPKYTE